MTAIRDAGDHGCHVCGRGIPEVDYLQRQNRTGKPGIWACADHLGRIKCAIDGCTRTSAGGPQGEWICVEHWRRYCPPRSARRRAYLSFFRKAKRAGGWSDELNARFWRFWDTLVGSARTRADRGKLDVAEINRIMGWE